jgi:4-hydroxy-3-methylbut-2-enyl diphosphate reductase
LTEGSYHQKGFGLKTVIEGSLRKDYHSNLVEHLRQSGFRLSVGDVEIRLAEEFGFCYGVDRAVEYAYETVEMFPGKKVTLIGEIIHNPHVNNRLRQMGVEIITPEQADATASVRFSPEDVVIIPAFGVPMPLFQTLRKTECVLVDTTCGSVLNVWKNVDKYCDAEVTSVIHGKYGHEETRATASRALRHEGGQYLIVRDMTEAQYVCDYIRKPGDREEFLKKFEPAISPGFDPDHHLEKIGLANQTTMLSSESLAIAEKLRLAMIDRYDDISERFRSFDTICSATQDRQDAVIKLSKDQLDVMLVIGGYNSSNTNHLAAITSNSTKTFHIESAACILNAATIRHKPVGGKLEIESDGWMKQGQIIVGVTAGASTPNNKIGEAIERVLACRDIRLSESDLKLAPSTA